MNAGVLTRLLPLLCSLVVVPMAGYTADLVEWQSSGSLTRLARASHKADFFPLSNHFISQDNAIFCGPVSSAIVLNALRLGKRDGLPVDRQSHRAARDGLAIGGR